MALDTGAASFRMMELPRSFPSDWARRFAARAAGPLEAVTDAESIGWVTSRHLLDTAISENTALVAGYVHLVMRIAQRKVPPALLRAECKLEELAVMAAENRTYLKSTDRASIRKGVLERLLPSMPPQLKAVPFIYAPGETHLFTGAVSEKQSDMIVALLASTLGMAPQPSDPEGLAAIARPKLSLDDLAGTSFSPEMPDDVMEPAPGREFLTWLWYAADTANGTLTLSDGRDLGFLLEGPLTFVHEAEGAFVTNLRKGAPESSLEAKSCLLAGKKLLSAKLTLALDDAHIWAFGVDSDLFAFRSMKLPKSDATDPLTRFQDRMGALADFRAIWLDLYGQFLDLRTDAAAWRKQVKKMREWVLARPARR